MAGSTESAQNKGLHHRKPPPLHRALTRIRRRETVHLEKKRCLWIIAPKFWICAQPWRFCARPRASWWRPGWKWTRQPSCPASIAMWAPAAPSCGPPPWTDRPCCSTTSKAIPAAASPSGCWPAGPGSPTCSAAKRKSWATWSRPVQPIPSSRWSSPGRRRPRKWSIWPLTPTLT